MKRFLLNVTAATVGLSLLSVAPVWAAGHSSHEPSRGGSVSSHEPSRGGSMNGSHGDHGHSFRANERFDYRRYGFNSLSWTHSRWSDYYRCYCYYSPRYGWCFYEPSYSSYVPISYYGEVYPQSAPVVASTPSVIQQTTVVTVPPTSVPDLPTPPTGPIPSAPPAPTALQKTNVGAGAP